MALTKLINATNAPYPCTVTLTFDQDLIPNKYLTNANEYILNNGAYVNVESVSIIDLRTVRLVVENLFGHETFTVTVNENIQNTGFELMNNAYLSYSFPILHTDYNDSLSSLSSSNGNLKSGTQATKIAHDNDSWYVLTESGIDVIDKRSLANKAFILSTIPFTTIKISGT